MSVGFVTPVSGSGGGGFSFLPTQSPLRGSLTSSSDSQVSMLLHPRLLLVSFLQSFRHKGAGPNSASHIRSFSHGALLQFWPACFPPFAATQRPVMVSVHDSQRHLQTCPSGQPSPLSGLQSHWQVPFPSGPVAWQIMPAGHCWADWQIQPGALPSQNPPTQVVPMGQGLFPLHF